ncbi:MAG: hypothetical protein IPL53_21740 [Ignavibacteria bacterium]|nr:hypothetical protein [Ignavibacteria bacterium]
MNIVFIASSRSIGPGITLQSGTQQLKVFGPSKSNSRLSDLYVSFAE